MLRKSLKVFGAPRSTLRPVPVHRLFSQSDKPSKEPIEYTVNDEELFSEKRMRETQKSIGEKLKAIKL